MSPSPGGPVGIYNGDANFGFNFTCHIDGRTDRPVIRGQITYHDSATSTVDEVEYPVIRLHGIVDPILVEGRRHMRGGGQGVPVLPGCGRFRGNLPASGPDVQCPGAASGTAGSSFRCSTRGSRAARAGRSPGTASPSNSSGAPTPPTPGEVHRGRQCPGDGK